MGRKRQSRNDLPSRMYFDHGAYYFVPKRGAKVNLGNDLPVAMKKYADILTGSIGTGSMAQIIEKYLREEAIKKAPRTLASNRKESKALIAIFGAMQPDNIKPSHIYKFLSLRPPIYGNRQKALLSCVFNYCIKLGITEKNPCKLVKANPEKRKKRNLTEKEFRAVYAIAPPVTKIMMDLAFMTGLRPGDLLSLKYSEHINKEGIHITTSKTDKEQTFKWTPSLRAVIKRAKKLRGNVSSLYVICNREGQRYTMDGFASNWQRVINNALKHKLIEKRFRFYDIRALAADKHNDPTSLLGHNDPRTTKKHYLNDAIIVDPNKKL